MLLHVNDSSVKFKEGFWSLSSSRTIQNELMIFLGEFKGRGRRRDLWGSEKVGEKRSQSPQLSQRTQHSE